MDVRSHNRAAWNRNVETQNLWTIPVGQEIIARARRGQFELLLTPTKSVPMDWFPDLAGLPTLCLASGGGQQGPVLAAAGAVVTVFDNSPSQLNQDRLVAEREGLPIAAIEGDMADLSVFPDETFGLIVHPVSNCFAPDIRPVWRECFRVLRPGRVLLAGFTNPVRYLFDDERMQNGSLEVRHSIPYSDVTDLNDADRRRWFWTRCNRSNSPTRWRTRSAGNSRLDLCWLDFSKTAIRKRIVTRSHITWRRSSPRAPLRVNDGTPRLISRHLMTARFW